MNYSDYRFSLDVNESLYYFSPTVKKGDTVRRLIVTLTQSGYPYLPGEGCTAVFRGEKPDGTVLFNECILSGGTVTVPITSQTISVPGTVKCEISVYSPSGDLLTSPSFDIIVEDTLSDENAVESSNEYTALAKLVGEIGGIEKTVNDAVKEALSNGPIPDGGNGIPGKDGISAYHSWDGTVLTVTSASGTSSADLKGEKGDTGAAGQDGFSPIVSISKTGKITTITITDKTGTKAATIKDGEDGANGGDESSGGTGTDGKDGIGIASIVQTSKSSEDDGINVITIILTDGTTHTFEVQNGSKGSNGDKGDSGDNGVSCTHSWNGTTLSVTSASGTSSADLKGEKGDKGDRGEKGDTGTAGNNGENGYSPTVSVSKSGKVTTITITDKNGTKTATINDGADGEDGKDGVNATTTLMASSSTDGLMAKELFQKLDGIAEGANKYTHPSYTAKSTQAVYKIKVDSTGHVSAAAAASTETWTFTLASGSTVTKKVVLG